MSPVLYRLSYRDRGAQYAAIAVILKRGIFAFFAAVFR